MVPKWNRRRLAGAFLHATLLFVAPAAATAAADPQQQGLSFADVWAQLRQRSPALRSAQLAADAAAQASARSGRHLVPRLGVTARGYATNEPGLSFFSLLGQRGVESADFEPGALNHPDFSAYAQAALQAEWIFYGGGRAARAQADEAGARRARFDVGAALQQLQAEAALHYGMVLVRGDSVARLQATRRSVAEVLRDYEVGTPDNPLAYSGKLGLQSLRNRIDALLAREEALRETSRAALSVLAGLPADWSPDEQTVDSFLRAHLPLPKGADAPPSPAVRALDEEARATRSLVAAEGARVLPQLGLSAEVPVLAGSRGVGAAFTGAAFARWSLDAADLGAARQTSLLADAQAARAEAEIERERVARLQALQAQQALEAAVPLLERNTELLREQTEIAHRLFLNGVINALQVAETLGRRVDLAEALAGARAGLVEARAALVRGAPAEGGAHER